MISKVAHIHKHFDSAFEDTTLEAGLAAVGASRIVQEFNVAMTWMSCPGRSTATAVAPDNDGQGPRRRLGDRTDTGAGASVGLCHG